MEVWVAHMPTVDKQILQIVALAGVFWTRYESIYFHDGGLGFDRNHEYIMVPCFSRCYQRLIDQLVVVSKFVCGLDTVCKIIAFIFFITI